MNPFSRLLKGIFSRFPKLKETRIGKRIYGSTISNKPPVATTEPNTERAPDYIYDVPDETADDIRYKRLKKTIEDAVYYTGKRISSTLMVRESADELLEIFNEYERKGLSGGQIVRALNTVFPDLDDTIDRLVYSVYDKEYAKWAYGGHGVGRANKQAQLDKLRGILDTLSPEENYIGRGSYDSYTN